MLERHGGRIVNIASIGGKVSVPHLLPYNCAKFAVVGFSEGLRAELAKDGVAVVTIAPGLMRTGGHVNARFKGRQEREYTWFSLGASLPFVSMDAERAARRIVRAARRGESEVTLSVPANLLALFHGLFPGTTADLLGLVNRLLPPADGGEPATQPGRELQERVRSRLLATLTTLGRSAAERYQHQGVSGES
jgi:short-subunit dehydrogenase